jgi:hypothetical protein
MGIKVKPDKKQKPKKANTAAITPSTPTFKTENKFQNFKIENKFEKNPARVALGMIVGIFY